MTERSVQPAIPAKASETDNTTGCSAGCKARTPTATIEKSGWERLEITGRWRCSSCARVLEQARAIPGTPAEFKPDPLPKSSIGALKKMPEAPPLHEKVKP